ncbi:hypothetical protein ACVXZ4_17510 [Lacisediminihabitans sp. FW035]
MATGTDSGEGPGDNTEPHPITSPFDWGLGSASAPVPATPPVPAGPAATPVPAEPVFPEVIPAEPPPTEVIPAPARSESYFSSDSDEYSDRAAPIDSPIDSLFGETEFKDYEDEPLVGPIPPRLNPFASAAPVASAGAPTGLMTEPNETSTVARPPRAPFSRNQKLLFWVAGGVIALLVLAVLFVIGTKIPGAPTPVAVTKSAAPKVSPSPTPTLATTGPAAAGSHLWSDLRGGECIDPYTNPFELRYTVVDCAAPHPAQMVFRGTFPGEATAAYPGLEALQSQINLLCSSPGVIDLATAGVYSDVQFHASYAATAEEWVKGQHDYFCFVNRSGGEPLTGSVAGTPAK